MYRHVYQWTAGAVGELCLSNIVKRTSSSTFIQDVTYSLHAITRAPSIHPPTHSNPAYIHFQFFFHLAHYWKQVSENKWPIYFFLFILFVCWAITVYPLILNNACHHINYIYIIFRILYVFCQHDLFLYLLILWYRLYRHPRCPVSRIQYNNDLILFHKSKIFKKEYFSWYIKCKKKVKYI